MAKQITKAVIPAAGLGKRLWPATKVLPKELIPIGTKPSIYFILEEVAAAGLQEAILIVAPAKKPHLAHLPETFPNLTFRFVEQPKPLGLGHAVGLAKEAVGQEPFLVLLPDDIVDHTETASGQLIAAFEKTGASVSAAKKIAKKESPLYGIYDIANGEGPCHRVRGVVEKPRPDEAPSDLGVFGRYLFTAEIFGHLQNTPRGQGGEIQLTDAMHTLAQSAQLHALELQGKLFDIGNPEGLARTGLHFAIKEYGNDIYQGLIQAS